MNEKIINVPLKTDTKSGLEKVADAKGRADCRQAAKYIEDGVKRDLAKMGGSK